METPQPLPVVLTLATLIDGLLEAVALRYGRFPIRGPLMRFLWKRFDRIKRQFVSIAARFAGEKAFRQRPARPRTTRAPRRPRDENAFRLTLWVNPKFGWLCRIASDSIGAGAFAYALRDLLENDPEMRALLAATPATARALHPLCHMLGVPTPPPPAIFAAACGAPEGAPLVEPADAVASGRPAVIAVVPYPVPAPAPAFSDARPPDAPIADLSVAFFKAA